MGSGPICIFITNKNGPYGLFCAIIYRCYAFTHIIYYLMHYFTDALKQYATFTGRATRKEFWMFVLMSIIAQILVSFVSWILIALTRLDVFAYLTPLFVLAIFLPSIAIGARRLHDTSRTGWWLLISFIPVIGSIWLLVLLCLESTPGANEYGANRNGVEVAMPTPTAAQVATPVTAPAPVETPKVSEPAEPPTLTPGASLN